MGFVLAVVAAVLLIGVAEGAAGKKSSGRLTRSDGPREFARRSRRARRGSTADAHRRVMATVLTTLRPPAPMRDAPTSPAPLVIAHRGASGYRPEHTLGGLPTGDRDGRRRHRARPGLHPRRGARRAAREQPDRQHRRRRPARVRRPPHDQGDRRPRRRPVGSPRTSPSPSCSRCARSSGCRWCGPATSSTTAGRRSRRSTRCCSSPPTSRCGSVATIGVAPETEAPRRTSPRSGCRSSSRWCARSRPSG